MTQTTVPTNTTTPQAISVSWDDAFAGKFPSSHAPWQQALHEAATALQGHPGIEPGRLARGLELALAGKVEDAAHGHTVRNGSHVYQIGVDGCTCQDSQQRSRWCKHYTAVAIVTRAQAEQAPGTVDDAEPEPVDPAWHRAVLTVADRARKALPERREQIEHAVHIAAARDIIPDGTDRYQVGAADETATYLVQDGECSCADADRIPGGWCPHKLAACIYQRACEQLETELAREEPDAEPAAEADDDERYEATAAGRKALADTAWTTQQAPSSVTLKWVTGGVECLLTLRDGTDEALYERIKKVLPRIHSSVERDRATRRQEAEANGVQQPESWCAMHQVEMRRWSRNGQAWHSHRDADGQWCRGGK